MMSEDPYFTTMNPILNDTDNMEYHEETVLLCCFCYQQFSTLEEVRVHMINLHQLIPDGAVLPALEKSVSSFKDDDNLNETKISPVVFKDFKAILKRHMIHKCTITGCRFKFESTEKLEMHIECHKGPQASEFMCFKCNLNHLGWRSCSSHLWRKHKLHIDVLSCPLCSFKSMTSVNVWKHMKKHKQWKLKVVKSLKRCLLKQTEKDRLLINPTNKYYTEKTCEICHRIFVNGKTLSKHVKDVHNKIKPFICNVCGWKSSRKYSLKIHMRQHTGEKPLACTDCEFTARDPSVLSKHKKKHNMFATLKCSHCLYVCTQTSNLKQHMKKRHPEEFDKISCDLCNFVTINETRLIMHKRDHRNGLIVNPEDSYYTNGENVSQKNQEKRIGNSEISSDCFLPLESTDSISHDPPLDTGGVTIPAHSDDTQFATFLNT